MQVALQVPEFHQLGQRIELPGAVRFGEWARQAADHPA
jgi:hypothetical protein